MRASDYFPRDMLVVVEKGVRPCETCGKAHDCYQRDPARPVAGVTWADPEDGHTYRAERWETSCRRLLKELGRETVVPAARRV